MKMLAAMAWRNLWRNKVRSGLTLGAMVFGLVVCLATFAIGDGAHQQMVRVATSTYLGHMKLNRQGYHKRQKLHLMMSDKSAPIRLLQAAVAPQQKGLKAWQRRIEAWSPRAFGAGLVSTGKNSAGGMLLGLDLARESRVTRLPEALLQAMAKEALASGRYKERLPGGYLADVKARLAELQRGAPKAGSEGAKRAQARHHTRQALHGATRALLRKTKQPGELFGKLLGEREVALGEGLATALKAKVGSSVAVVTQAYDGSMGNDRYTVAAIVRSGNADMDLSLCLMPLAQLQGLLALDGQYHTAVLRLTTHDGGAIQATADAFAAQLKAADVPALTRPSEKLRSHKAPPGYEILSWQRAAPDLYEFIRADEAGQFLMALIVFFLVAFVILNTLQMSLLERTREFGVLMSLGMKGRKLVGMVMMEALWMSGFTIVVGLALGVPMMAYLQAVGVPLGEPLQMGGVTLALKLEGKITMQGLLYSPAVVLLTTLLVSFYPAYRVTKLKPTEAMRNI